MLIGGDGVDDDDDDVTLTLRACLSRLSACPFEINTTSLASRGATGATMVLRLLIVVLKEVPGTFPGHLLGDAGRCHRIREVRGERCFETFG